MKRDSRSPQAYRSDVEGKQRELLEALRTLIFEAAPDVEEGIEYGMLSYPGVACLAAQKNSVNLYVSPVALARHRKMFGDCGKSCIRFQRLDQVNIADVRRLLEDAQSS